MDIGALLCVMAVAIVGSAWGETQPSGEVRGLDVPSL